MHRIRVNCHKHNDLYNYIQKKKHLDVVNDLFFVMIVSRSLALYIVEYR